MSSPLLDNLITTTDVRWRAGYMPRYLRVPAAARRLGGLIGFVTGSLVLLRCLFVPAMIVLFAVSGYCITDIPA